jgi:putative DNA primase/helicase
LNNRGDDNAKHDTEACIQQVRAFLELHGASRFQPLESMDVHVSNRVGYKRENNETREIEYLILPEAFKREVCKNFNPTFVAKELERRGYLKRKINDKYAQVVYVKNMKKGMRLYVITASIFEGEPESKSSDLVQDTFF